MPRKRMCRKMAGLPEVKGFRPFDREPFRLPPVIITLDQFEAIRLADYEKLNQEEAAVKMGISRPTFTRLYEEARNRLAEALIEGKSFIIEGGEVSFSSVSFRCSDCKHSFQTSKEEAETTTACPKCKSTQIVSMNDFFLKGCQCRKNWY
ncbi:MAG: hypothetical protein A2Y41_09420 [Spirochaetes bacterium GWB1_36_13]|nr:MAG: hypothetical protein A2Y41_09420 [Spirochaetes bacterium GWB1_36_13]